MAERWQQWMPFHIDRFRGSPDVQAMHPVARMGYLYLLASAWQTDDCTISDDPLDLASMSGLGDDLWAQYCPRILRKFQCDEIGGRLYNPVLREEWCEAKRIFEKNHGPKLTPEEISEARSKAGKAGAQARWQKSGKQMANDSKNDGKRMANDGYTGTGTGTSTGSTNTLALTSVEVHAETVFELPLIGDQGEWGLPQNLFDELVTLYPAVSVMAELAAMRAWLLTNPKNRKTPDGLPRFINTWLKKAQNETPRNTGGNTYGKPTLTDNIAAKQRALDGRAARRMADAGYNTGRTLEAGSADAGRDGTERADGSLFRVS